jgi:hypothetical protein
MLCVTKFDLKKLINFGPFSLYLKLTTNVFTHSLLIIMRTVAGTVKTLVAYGYHKSLVLARRE